MGMEAEPPDLPPTPAEALMLAKSANLCKHLYLSSKTGMVNASMWKGFGNDNTFLAFMREGMVLQKRAWNLKWDSNPCPTPSEPHFFFCIMSDTSRNYYEDVVIKRVERVLQTVKY